MKLIVVGLFLCFSISTIAAPALPSDSIYQVGGTWQTEMNQSIQLESLAGKPQIISLIFTGCSNACPIIIESMKRIESQVPTKMRSKIGFVLVTLTPDTDTPKALKGFADKKGLNSNWKILRGNNELVRTLANALNSRYKAIKDGDVAHSNTVTLLNNQGQIRMQTSGTLTGIKAISETIEKEYPELSIQ